MNDQHFFDLAMKAVARQSTDAERAELDAAIASQPALKAEWEKLQSDARLAREVAPLVAATQSAGGEFPAYARERLQTKVRQTLGTTAEATPGNRWNWRWLAGLATAAAVVVLLVLPSMKPSAPIIQVAMLDTGGAIRGADSKELDVLKQRWPVSSVETFSGTNALAAWQSQWPAGNSPAAKVVYDRSAGEVLVFSRGENKPKVFVIERDLAGTLLEVDQFIRRQTSIK